MAHTGVSRVLSEFSLGFGIAPIPDLVRRAADLEIRALALTDREMYGQVQFHHACKAAGIRAITGVELPDGRVALARNRAGYEALCRREYVESRDLAILREPPPAAIFVEPEDHRLHVLLRAIFEGVTLSDVRDCAPADRILRPQEFAFESDLDLTDVRPIFPVRSGNLRALCGASNARLERELSVIERLGFDDYFLVVAEIVRHAREVGIEVAGRGSAAGSLVAYRLGITQVDPEALGLYFERFLHEDRPDFPDIDVDVASDRRDELIEWVFRRFGRERVAMVSSMQTFRRRSAYREGLKAIGMRRSDVEAFCARIPEDDLPELPVPVHLLPEPYRERVPLIERLIGRPQHLSVHPGGVVIADREIDRYTPLEVAPKGVVVTQYDLRSVSKIGLVKIDLLGNRCLSEIAEVGVRGIPMEDRETLEAIGGARTIGCFQIESPALRAALRRRTIASVDDVMAALASVRPGPAAGDWLYEEDIMTVIRDLTGMSLSQADRLRGQIVDGAAERPASIPPNVWIKLTRYAAYTFNKAHAASYARLAYLSAYLKTHHRVAFGAALLNHHGGVYPLRTIAADLAREGVRILPPDIQVSPLRSAVEGDAIRVGLDRIKHLTKKSKAAILASRPFRTMNDVVDRLRPSKRELEALVLSGACDALIPGDYPFAHEGYLTDAWIAPVPSPKVDPYRRLVRVRNELRFLDMHVSDHPLRILRPEAERIGCVPIADARGRTRIAAIVAAARRILTHGGDLMQFVTLEDETGLMEAVVFPDVYANLGDPIQNPGPFLVTGRVIADQLEVQEVLPFHRRK